VNVSSSTGSFRRNDRLGVHPGTLCDFRCGHELIDGRCQKQTRAAGVHALAGLRVGPLQQRSAAQHALPPRSKQRRVVRCICAAQLNVQHRTHVRAEQIGTHQATRVHDCL
jgi:hypothetical protein